MCSHINVGSGIDVSIDELATLISETVGFKGEITYDNTKPDGPPRKLTDNTKLRDLGWRPIVSLKEGLKNAYEWYINHQKNITLCPN
jgi:GDP-L-fucose synthase